MPEQEQETLQRDSRSSTSVCLRSMASSPARLRYPHVQLKTHRHLFLPLCKQIPTQSPPPSNPCRRPCGAAKGVGCILCIVCPLYSYVQLRCTCSPRFARGLDMCITGDMGMSLHPYTSATRGIGCLPRGDGSVRILCSHLHLRRTYSPRLRSRHGHGHHWGHGYESVSVHERKRHCRCWLLRLDLPPTAQDAGDGVPV
ncbi:hypothetical protein DFH06DRAFT_1254833 [Mycena polygramma]|nr:hypothetical protein DFH06DRAFT_1254833 [Mycena polygramma]